METGNKTIRPMTKTQLAQQYGVCLKTFSKWIQPFLSEIGVKNRTYIYTVVQVTVIYDKLGDPRD